MTFEEQITERVRETMELWPMLDSAFGCENCRLVYRNLDRLNMMCPQCKSESIFDVAALLGGKSILPRAMPMIPPHDDSGDRPTPAAEKEGGAG